MSKRPAVLLVALLTLAVIWVLRGSKLRSVPETRGAQPNTDVDVQDTSELAIPPTDEVLAPVEGEASEPARASVEPTSAAPVAASAKDPALAEIHGRFLLEDGSPAAGVACRVHGWGANEERRLKYGEPEDWSDPTGETDGAGELRVRFDPPRAFQFTLDAKLDGHAEASWRWSEILPGETVELGDVVLQRGGAIEGHLVDSRGEPILGEQWTIYADAGRGRGRTRDRDSTRGIAGLDPTTGSFRIEDMPPGEASLQAHSDMANWVEGPVVTVRQGEVVRADLRYEGPDNSTRITVSTFSDPFYVMQHPDDLSILLEGIEGGPRIAEKIERSSQSYSFDDVPPGVYTLVIDDPRYRPWRKDGVTPGQDVNAHLVGNAALRFAVADGSTGAEIDRYAVRVRFRNVNFRPNEFEVHDGATPLAGGLLEGMFAGDYTIRISAEGYGPTEIDVDALQPNETRSVDVELGGVRLVHGHLMAATKAPASGQDVKLLRETDPVDEEDSFALPVVLEDGAYFMEVDAETTDGLGAFRFEVVSGAKHVLLSEPSAGVRAVSQPFALSPGEDRSIDLVLPATTSIEGRLTGLAPADLQQFVIRAVPGEAPGGGAFPMRLPEADLGAGGAFAFDDLAAGRVELHLLVGESDWMSFDEEGRPSGGRQIAELDLAPGEHKSVDIDASGCRPARLEVRVVHNEEPGSGLNVWSALADGASSSAGVADAQGKAVLVMFAGSYRISVAGQTWNHAHPTPILVGAGEHAVLDIVVETAAGTLSITDEGGQALSQCMVQVSGTADGSWFPSAMVQSDDDGRIQLELSIGDYSLHAFRMDENAQAKYTGSLQWTREGPSVDEVRLTRVEGY